MSTKPKRRKLGAQHLHRSREHREHVLLTRFFAMLVILLVYILGRRVILTGIDLSAYLGETGAGDDLLLQAAGGDRQKISVFALGIAPHMIASLLTTMITSVRRAVSRSRVSLRKMERFTSFTALAIAIVQASLTAGQLHYLAPEEKLWMAQGLAAVEMVAGAMLILWLCNQNKDYGIGRQSMLIIFNIVEGLTGSLRGHTVRELTIPLCCCLAAMFIMLLMENAEYRIPVQRISIYNVYSDKNYLAFKLNPISVMPVMFSVAAFTLVKTLISLLRSLLPEAELLLQAEEALALTQPAGVCVYIAIIFVLNIVFSLLFLSPGDMAEQLLKSGDSIVNLHSGRATKRYLVRCVLILSFFSAAVMSVCVGVPLLLQIQTGYPAELSTLPSTFMMLTGISVNLTREIETYRSYDAYRAIL